MNFRQTADKMMETFNPHPSATDIVRKHNSHRNARKHLRKLGVTRGEQDKLIRATKAKDPSWPKHK